MRTGSLILAARPSGADPALLTPVAAVSSSDENETLVAANAIDGNGATRWASRDALPQWIYVDYGSTRTFTSLQIDWEVAYDSAFNIDVSADAASWTTVVTGAAGVGSATSTHAFAATGRYLRIYATARGTAYADSIYEIRAYGF